MLLVPLLLLALSGPDDGPPPVTLEVPVSAPALPAEVSSLLAERGPRLRLERGRASLVDTTGLTPMYAPIERQRLSAAGHLEVGAVSELDLSWSGHGSLHMVGSGALEWTSLPFLEGGSIDLLDFRLADLEVRTGRLWLGLPGDVHLELRRGAVQLVGLSSGRYELRHLGGEPARIVQPSLDGIEELSLTSGAVLQVDAGALLERVRHREANEVALAVALAEAEAEAEAALAAALEAEELRLQAELAAELPGNPESLDGAGPTSLEQPTQPITVSEPAFAMEPVTATEPINATEAPAESLPDPYWGPWPEAPEQTEAPEATEPETEATPSGPSPEPTDWSSDRPIIDPVVLLPTFEPEPAEAQVPELPIIDPVVLVQPIMPADQAPPEPIVTTLAASEPAIDPLAPSSPATTVEGAPQGTSVAQATPGRTTEPLAEPEAQDVVPGTQATPESAPDPRQSVRLVLRGPVLPLGAGSGRAPGKPGSQSVLRVASVPDGGQVLELRGMVRMTMGPFGPLPLALPFLVQPSPEPALPRLGPAPAMPTSTSTSAADKEFTLSDLLNGRVEN